MPLKTSKRQKNKLYYSQHKNKINCSSKLYHELNRVKVMENSLTQQTAAAQVNPDKAKVDVRQRVMEYRQRNPDKIRASSSLSVAEYHKKEPEKARVATRLSVSEHYRRDPEKARAATRLRVSEHCKRETEKSKVANRNDAYRHYHRNLKKSRSATRHKMMAYRQKYPDKYRADNRYWVAKSYNKCLQKSRRKSRYSSMIVHRKKASIISRQKRDRYCLAEPRQQKITCLLKSFQDAFYSKKKIRSQIMNSLEYLPNIKAKQGLATNYALCKLSC